MKSLRSPLFPLALVFAGMLALGLWGCATADSVAIPRAPAWVQVDGAPTVPVATVVAECQRVLPGVPVTYADGTYAIVSHAWLEDYIRWTSKAAFAADVAYTAESWDCDDFGLGFYLIATRKAAQAGVKAAPLIGRITVAQTSTFATVRGTSTGRHALIGVATDRGLFIVEPQPAGGLRIAPLAVYPNRILAVTFGDYNPR
ncbi:MAG: hypothetical protein KF897_15040 [Opitutaceae bacterium]|jgi:hypothetical protein|nr:hypothetical protein [Opitutaceae bacterium]